MEDGLSLEAKASAAARGGRCPSAPGPGASRHEWRCRNRACPVPHGAVLGRLTSDDGLVLDPAVQHFRCFLDTRRAEVACPACYQEREFHGVGIISALTSVPLND